MLRMIDSGNSLKRTVPGSASRLVLVILLLLALAHAAAVLLIGINKPLLDLHAFRQTQTALSAYTILHGGPWIAYETPVLGYPWSIPFEFPVYQLLAALLAWTGVPLDAAGRLVSFGFFLLMPAPLALLYRTAGLGRAAFVMTAILYLTSPIYLYWSRTFLMESCALFFSLSWLALTLRYLAAPNRFWLLAAIGCGCAAILTKSTTFVPFAVAGGVWTLFRIWRLRSETSGRPLLRAASAAAVNLLIPFVVGLAWVRYSDQIKTGNPFGRMLTAQALTAWNFGSLSQRFSATLWVDTVWNRVLPDVAGYFAAVAVMVLGATLTTRRTLLAAAIAGAGFVLPFVIFTNLHIVHNYYQNANAIFLIAAVGLGLGRIFETSQRAVAIVLLVIIAAGQLWLYYERFMPFQLVDYSQDRMLRIAQAARDNTDAKAALIVIDGDWSSVIPYYSNRRSLVVPGWPRREAIKPILDAVFSDPTPFLGGAALGGVVYCADALPTYGDRAPLVQAFVAGRQRLAEFGGCELLSPDR
jgi:hypothetical protein